VFSLSSVAHVHIDAQSGTFSTVTETAVSTDAVDICARLHLHHQYAQNKGNQLSETSNILCQHTHEARQSLQQIASRNN